MDPLTILAPTGSLGYGFDPEALERGMTLKPAALAVDAGSTDPGPHYLASGEPLCPRVSIERELEMILGQALKHDIPAIVGSCGGSGSDPHLAWVADIVRDLARKHGWHFKMATIGAELAPDTVLRALHEGRISDFEAGQLPTEEEIRTSSHIVAQMGPEPIIRAIEQGAQVVLAGRACDDAVIAALPIQRGYDPGLALHMGKILECGAFCAEPFAMDVMLGTIDAQGFVLEPGSLGRRCSVASVAGHSLYEREDPFIQHGPGHVVDMTQTQFSQLNERQVRVTGTRFAAQKPYRVKLEGARSIGYRTICVSGVRCPTMVSRIDGILADVRRRVERYFATNEPFTLLFHTYGKNGVMGALETVKHTASHEIGLVTEVIAPTQEMAHAICHVTTGMLLHWSYEGVKNNAGNLAFLYSPSEQDAGPAYVFSVYHLMDVADEYAHFPIRVETV